MSKPIAQNPLSHGDNPPILCEYVPDQSVDLCGVLDMEGTAIGVFVTVEENDPV